MERITIERRKPVAGDQYFRCLFAWQIDFYDVKEGDSFRVLYDIAYIDDTTALNISGIQGSNFHSSGKRLRRYPLYPGQRIRILRPGREQSA